MVTLSRATNLRPSEGDHMTGHMTRHLLEDKSDMDNITYCVLLPRNLHYQSDAPVAICI